MTKLDDFFNTLHPFGGNFNAIVSKGKWSVESWSNNIDELIAQIDPSKQQYFHTLNHDPELAGKRGQKSSATGFQFLWADIDTSRKECKKDGCEYPRYEDARDALLSLLTPPSILVDSGRGIHAYWLLDQQYSPDKLPHRFMGYLGKHIGQMDEQKFNEAKLLRVPETTNSTGSGLVEVIHFDPETRYTLEEIEAVIGKEIPLTEALKTDNPIDVAGLIGEQSERMAQTCNGRTIEEMLREHGYTQVSTDRWLSPHSASGQAGIWVDHENNRLHCHHMNDPLRRSHSVESVYRVLYEIYREITPQQSPLTQLTSPVALEVSERAYKAAIEALKKYGNTVSDDHAKAVQQMIDGFCAMAIEGQEARVAYPLFTGGGKTTAIKAFVKALDETNNESKLVICTEKVEALCDVYRDLVAAGISEEKIGLFHGYRFDPDFDIERPKAGKASVEANNNEQAQFILMSHQKVRVLKDDLRQVVLDADLMIWDESMVVAEGLSIDYADALMAIDGWCHRFESKLSAGRTVPSNSAYTMDDYHRFHEWLVESKRVLQESEDGIVGLPFLLDTDSARPMVNVLLSKRNYQRSNESLNKLVKFYQQGEIRLMKDRGVIQYRTLIDPRLKKIAILDASFPIRTLLHHNSSVTVEEIKATKDYSPVMINHFHYGSGRQTTTEKLKAVGGEVIEICKRHDGEDILIFTFKEKDKGDLVERMKEQFRREGVPLHRLHFLTWGYETSINRYSHCSVVIFAGVLHREDLSLSADIIGEAQDLGYPVHQRNITNVKNGEMAYSIHQALSRGTCRVTKDGKALPMTAYMWMAKGLDQIKESISEVMPNVQFKLYEPTYLKAARTHDNNFINTLIDVTDGILMKRMDSGQSQSSKAVLSDLSDAGYNPSKKEWEKARDRLPHFDRKGRGFVVSE